MKLFSPLLSLFFLVKYLFIETQEISGFAPRQQQEGQTDSQPRFFALKCSLGKKKKNVRFRLLWTLSPVVVFACTAVSAFGWARASSHVHASQYDESRTFSHLDLLSVWLCCSLILKSQNLLFHWWKFYTVYPQWHYNLCCTVLEEVFSFLTYTKVQIQEN